jgi:hypothetical protein
MYFAGRATLPLTTRISARILAVEEDVTIHNFNPTHPSTQSSFASIACVASVWQFKKSVGLLAAVSAKEAIAP